MKNKSLSVRLNGQPVGILEENSNGKLEFSYLEGGRQISHSLPYSTHHVFAESECKPFFDGLLPDSEEARKRIAAQHHFSYQNTFRLLEAIGRESTGAISFHEMSNSICPREWESRDVEWVDDSSMEEYIHQLPRYPLLNGTGGVRLSLAGAQDKACICYDPQSEKKFGITKSGSPSTHILKPEIKGYPNSAYNEYFCLRLANATQLEASNVHFTKVNQTPCLIVERYDRKVWLKDGEYLIKRLHQEDFCQALGKLSSNKYQKEGGPSLKDCFNLLDRMGGYILIMDRIKLSEYIIFNFLVGNADAHGKNYSILYSSTADHVTQEKYTEYESMTPQLAPLYDVLCCQIYPELSSEMAMKIGEKYTRNDVYGRHWQRLCQSAGLSFPEFKKSANNMCERILRGLQGIQNSLEEPDIFDNDRKDWKIHNEYRDFRISLVSLIEQNIHVFKQRMNDTSS